VRRDERGLRLLIGYPLSSSGRPVFDVDEVEKTDPQEFSGDFLCF
jgi:hypothetical protein